MQMVFMWVDDMACVKAREILGPDKIIGVSAHTIEEARIAKEHGADYLGIGAIFLHLLKMMRKY